MRGAGSDPGKGRTDDKGGTVRGAVVKRPDLREIPLAHALEVLGGQVVQGTVIVTMSRGQWDTVLSESYRLGFLLLELDWNEHPVAAYQRAQANGGES